MDKLSIIIPSRDEPYLNKTLEDILKKAIGEIEIFVTIDEDWPDKVIKDKRIIYIHPRKPEGMRAGINNGLTRARGDYIMKCDAHCLFAKGFDETLKKDMQENWLVVPRRYSLHGDWVRDLRMPVKDYHYLSFPQQSKFYGYGMFPQEWKERTQERMVGHDIDDTMIMQGSCWFANKDYFMKHVGLLDSTNYSTFSGEQLEVGLKYWLGGGEIKVNKKTWYAHLFKNLNYYKGKMKNKLYKIDLKSKGGWEWATKHWINDLEPSMVHPISWLIEKFWPVPGWPEDRSLWKLK